MHALLSPQRQPSPVGDATRRLVPEMNDTNWYLKSCWVFDGLPADEISAIESKCMTREFHRGDVIYVPSDPGDSAMILARGRVRIYHVKGEGKQTILRFAEPGELFGELSAFQSVHREEFAEATEKTVVLQLPRDVLLQIIGQHSDVSMKMTELFSQRLRQLEQRLKSLLFQSSRERLLHVLQELAEKYGRSTATGIVIAQKISHQDIASLIGATRETVTITLGELQTEGVIEINRRRITLRNKFARTAPAVATPGVT